MNAEDLLAYVTYAGFLFIFVAALAEATRTRRRAAWDAAMFFAAIAGIILPNLLVRLGLVAATVASGSVVAALLVMLPYLQVRMAHDFEAVPRGVRRAAFAIGVASVLSLFLMPSPLPPLYVLAIVVGFVVVQAYCTTRLVASLRGTVGVTHGRSQAMALGSAMLVAVMVLAGFQTFFPDQRGLWRALTSAASLGCAVGYFVGFTPPRWMRRLWQAPSIRQFLSTAATLPTGHAPHELAAGLEAAVRVAVGAQRAQIAIWEVSQRALVSQRAGHSDAPAEPCGTTLGTRVFREQRPLLVDDATRLDPANAEVYRATGCVSALLAPISIGDQRFGVLGAYADRPSRFAEDDLALLALLADEIAGLLQRQQLTQAAAHVRAQQEATELKDEFLSAAAHDLRTPLTVILAQAQLLGRRLRRAGASAQDLAGVDRLVLEAQRMRRLTDDVLDASSAEATGFVNKVALADLAEIAQGTAASVTSDRHPVLVLGGALEAMVDEARIRQVVQNLVENAVKFSPGGGRITISCAREDDNAHVIVADQGIGIPPWDLPHLFQRFYRGGSSGERGFSGMGIGLFLCKRIVEEHGGTISAESVEGEGTRFHVILPLVGEETRDKQRRANASTHSRG